MKSEKCYLKVFEPLNILIIIEFNLIIFRNAYMHEISKKCIHTLMMICLRNIVLFEANTLLYTDMMRVL